MTLVGLDRDPQALALAEQRLAPFAARTRLVHAVYDECSHAAVPLSEGEIEDCTLECWLHGSRFDLRTGAPTGLPATEPVPVYPVEIQDGWIYVSGVKQP